MTKIWGPPTWNFIHSFCARIEESKFQENKLSIFDFIRIILSNLPCPICSDHATKMFNSKIAHIRNKNDLCLYFYHFHNEVTMRTNKFKKPNIPEKEILENYKNNNVRKIFNIYFRTWEQSTSQKNVVTMTSTFMKHTYINSSIKWLKDNNNLLEKNSFLPY